MPESPRQKPAARIALSTHWTDLKLAAQVASELPDARAAFQNFCERYWSAVYHVLRSRYPEAYAQDLTQQFFLKHIIEREALTKLDRERGSFRAWLYSALQHFVIDEWRRSTSAARDHRVEHPLDERTSSAPSMSVTSYEWHYANAAAERALSALHARWAPKFAAHGAVVEKPQMISWLVDRDSQLIAAALGIRADNARQTVRRLYVDLWQLLEADIAQTVDAAHVAAELDEICRILGVISPRASDA
jgi:RNA polymerase sigma factor (sigma-70 family)